MIIHHKPENLNLELDTAIARHSADQVISYKEVDGQPLFLALFLPRGLTPGERRGTIFLIHGGGWSTRKIFADQTGWQGDHLGFLARYYADRGFLCVGIDYRLIQDGGQKPGYGLPDLCQDCCDAVRFAVDHSRMLGIDPEKLYLLGESAGGYLAAMLPTFPECFPIQFRTLFLVNPITDLKMESWSGFVPSNLDGADFSPVNRISEKMPASVLLHGTADKVVSPRHSELFERRMRKKSRPCAMHLLNGAHHAFLLAEYYKDGMDACKTAIGILDQVLLSDRATIPEESGGRHGKALH